MCCLLTGVSFALLVFFAIALVGNIISGSDGGLMLVYLFGSAILCVFLLALSRIF
jgi:hypothetical protein